jgi:hypothetical protein
LLVLAGGLTGGFLGRTMSRNRGSVIVGMALGALAGAAGDYMSALRQHRPSTAESAVCEMAGYLCQHLSEEVTAYLSGLSETETVRAWAEGYVSPAPEERFRLEVAYEAARCLVPDCGDEMTRSWFFGMNPLLQDTAPAYVLRNWSRESWATVLTAAQEFAEI